MASLWGSTPTQVEASLCAMVAALEIVICQAERDPRWQSLVAEARVHLRGSASTWLGASEDLAEPTRSGQVALDAVRVGVLGVIGQAQARMDCLADPPSDPDTADQIKRLLGRQLEDHVWFRGAAEWEMALYATLVCWVTVDGRLAPTEFAQLYSDETRKRVARRPGTSGSTCTNFSDIEGVTASDLGDEDRDARIGTVVSSTREVLHRLEIELPLV